MSETLNPSESPALPLGDSETAPRQGVTFRSVVAGILCVALVCVLVTQAELVVQSIRIGYLQLPPVSIALLAGVLLVSQLMKTIFGKRFGFAPAEMAVVYVMSIVAAMVSSHGVVQKWLPLLVAPIYFSNNTSNYFNIFNLFPKSMLPYDPNGSPKQDVATWYYEGLPKDAAIPWHNWIGPVLVGGLLLLLVISAFIFLTSLLRRQWIDSEKLAFPLAQLPLEMMGHDSTSGSIFSKPLTWGGILLPVIIYGIDWIHQFAPSVPLIPTSILLNTYLTTPPLNQIAYTPLVYSFAAIGFFYLLSTDILFSIWFFFLLTRIEQVIAISVNMDMPAMPMYPPPLFVGYQTAGAYVVLVCYFFIIAKPHLSRVWQAVLGKGPYVNDTQEMMSYRSAAIGLAVSLIGAIAMLTSMGMSLWLSALEILGFVFIIAIVMARTTAEAGMLMTETTFRPIDLFRIGGNLHSLGPVNLNMLAFVDNLLLRDQRGLILTGLLDSARVADGTNLKRPQLVRVLVIGILVALCVAVPLQIYLPYTTGGLKMDSWMMHNSPLTSLNDYKQYFTAGSQPIRNPWQMPVFFGVGVAMTIFLTVMRSMFYWWPLHPLGYAIAGSWSTVQFWFPCFLAWMFKSVTMRYGGVASYQRLKPFFLGMIIGEFSVAVISVLVYMWTGYVPPPFPWG
ncbi:MAG TPA: DUF6785 family protein [Capsulimonadaceae bacterium]|jgi:hypothetical protein